jgi:anti-anti-sigma factor
MTIPTPGFRCELRRDRHVTAVVVRGELEEISAVQLAAACLHAGDVDGDGRVSGDVVLDVVGVSFADGTGIQMIATMHRCFERAGHRLTIVGPSPRVQAEIDRTGLDGVVRVEPEMPVPAALTG